MRLALRCILLSQVALAAMASAHHSPALFDPQKVFELKGTVRDFQWHNPHCYIQLLVPNDRGEQDEWSLETGAPVILYNLGWRPNSLKPGDVITVKVWPLRNGDKGALVQEVAMSDGRKVGGGEK